MPISQTLINGLLRGTQLAIIAVGLTMIFKILRFANFAHVSLITIGAFLVYLFYVTVNMNLGISVLLACTLTGIIAVAIDRVVFKRMRTAGSVTPMIASLGLSIAIRNGIRAIGGSTIRYYEETVSAGIEFLGGRITIPQIWIIGIVATSMLSFHFLLQKTKLGKAMRATSDNLVLAEARGIETERVIIYAWFIGASFAGLGGFLIGWDTQIYPAMGFDMVIPVFCAVLLGGIGNVYGAMLGAMVLGFAENLAVFFDFASIINMGGIIKLVDSVRVPIQYKYGVSFVILVIVLLLRPSGIMGKR